MNCQSLPIISISSLKVLHFLPIFSIPTKYGQYQSSFCIPSLQHSFTKSKRCWVKCFDNSRPQKIFALWNFHPFSCNRTPLSKHQQRIYHISNTIVQSYITYITYECNFFFRVSKWWANDPPFLININASKRKAKVLLERYCI